MTGEPISAGEVEARTKCKPSRHGLVGTPEYRSWTDMKTRCNNPKRRSYANYGARGIKVCPEWEASFKQFLADMGPRPADCISVDRIDVNGDYSPTNCKWASHKEQNRNRRNHRWVELDGQRVPLSQACEASGIKYHVAKWRIRQGRSWREEERPADG